MFAMTCQKCKSDFYTASPSWVKSCPYCGYTFDSPELIRRKAKRDAIVKGCVITKGNLSLAVKTVDISKNGICVKINGAIPFHIDDTVKVVIKDFDCNAEAKIVWVKSTMSTLTRAGLLFS